MDLEAWCRWYERRGAGRLRHLLMRHWDPIGVRDDPDFRTEYDSYLGRIAERLRRERGPDDVADLLAEVEREWMDMTSDRSEIVRIAQLLVRWYQDEVARASVVR